MILEDILALDLHGKNVLIIGRAGSGKTYISYALKRINKYHALIHTDSYLTRCFGEERQIEAIVEDAIYDSPAIIEGMLAYPLLLEGAKRKYYIPDIVIICEISAGKQREVYLKERDASKIQYQKRFALKMQAILNEYHSLVPEAEKPMFYEFKNNF